jgi:hypothetical protein
MPSELRIEPFAPLSGLQVFLPHTSVGVRRPLLSVDQLEFPQVLSTLRSSSCVRS